MLPVWGVPAVGVPCRGTENMLSSFLLLYRASSNPQKSGKSRSQWVPAQGVVTTPGCSSEHPSVHGLAARHCCVIHGQTVLSSPLSGAFPLSPSHIVVIYSDLAVFSCCWTLLGAAQDSQRSVCSVCHNLFSGTHNLGLGTACPCTGRCQIKPKHSQTAPLLQCRWIWAFPVTCRMGSGPCWCCLSCWVCYHHSSYLPVYQNSHPADGFLGKGCQITLNCAVMSSEESRDKNTELFFTWLNQALYLALQMENTRQFHIPYLPGSLALLSGTGLFIKKRKKECEKGKIIQIVLVESMWFPVRFY